MSRIIVDEDRHVRDGRDGGRWETVVGDRDILGSGQCHDHHLLSGGGHMALGIAGFSIIFRLQLSFIT